MFRPFKGETILGKISSATPEGIHSTCGGLLDMRFITWPPSLTDHLCDLVRTDFFEEIFVPYKELPENTEL